MTTDFQSTIKRLEDCIAGGKWDRAELELRNAYVLQPTNRYLDAYAQRLDSLRAPSASGAAAPPAPGIGGMR